MEIQTSETIGIPWYEAASYELILEIMEDASLLPSTYPMWLRGAMEVLAHEAGDGVRRVKVPIDPSTFLDWCKARDYPADAVSRLEFAEAVADGQLYITAGAA